MQNSALLFLAAAFVYAATATGSLPQHYEQQVFAEVNRYRAAHELRPLAWDERLAEVAREHSARMRDANYFSHQDPQRGGVAQRLTRARIAWTVCGENIYTEQGYRNPVRSAGESWMRSQQHRRSILDRRYTRTGVGIAAAPNGTYWFTQIFVRP
jgi:uncharacterized protein YkwD